ncbi:hypothetical protein O3M35_007981 [Rhynocoris fuscipes]|uniref:Odorant receptor n=1 Tax=Rhynocoris fuscipes TaxID=488301 RepID=A0AAW1DIM0_9HEMI
MAWSERLKLIRQVVTGDTDDMEFLTGYELSVFYGLTFDHSLMSVLAILKMLIFFVGLFGSYVRRPILEAAYTKYPIPYIGWLPFEIDNLAKCIAVYILQAILTGNVVCGHYCFVVSFAIQANHLISQCKLLATYLDETIEYRTIIYLEKEEYIASRLKEAIKKHQLLIRCFKLLQDLYSSSLLAMSLASGLLFCSLIYMLTDPDSSVYMIASVSSFLIPEFTLILMYCWFGQLIIDKWENIKDTIYNIEWYTQSITTKKTLLLIMTMCTRDKVIKGGGLQEFSMKGFSELVKHSLAREPSSAAL